MLLGDGVGSMAGDVVQIEPTKYWAKQAEAEGRRVELAEKASESARLITLDQDGARLWWRGKQERVVGMVREQLPFFGFNTETLWKKRRRCNCGWPITDFHIQIAGKKWCPFGRRAVNGDVALVNSRLAELHQDDLCFWSDMQ